MVSQVSDQELWQQHLLLVDGHTVAVQIHRNANHAPVVLLLHGITGSVDFWPLLLTPEFMSRYTCISVSLPGHAPSLLPEEFGPHNVVPGLFVGQIRSVLDTFCSDRKVHVVGWSTGGFAALAAAAECPNRFHSVTSICGFVRGHWHGSLGILQWLAASGLPDSFFHAVFRVLQTRTRLTYLTLRRYAGRLNSAAAVQTFDLQLTKSECIATLKSLHSESIRIMMAGLRTVDISDELLRIACPATIIYGRLDPVILPEEAALMMASVAQARGIELPEAGHMFFAEAFDTVLQHISETIESASSAADTGRDTQNVTADPRI